MVLIKKKMSYSSLKGTYLEGQVGLKLHKL